MVKSSPIAVPTGRDLLGRPVVCEPALRPREAYVCERYVGPNKMTLEAIAWSMDLSFTRARQLLLQGLRRIAYRELPDLKGVRYGGAALRERQKYRELVHRYFPDVKWAGPSTAESEREPYSGTLMAPGHPHGTE